MTSRDLSLDHREQFPQIFIPSCGEAERRHLHSQPLHQYFSHILKDFRSKPPDSPPPRLYPKGAMISQRQLAANRRNAAKSHGPKTPEGRAAVRLNALKHGFTAAEIILPTVEAEADFEAFRQAFEDKCQPVGPIEEVLVEDIVISRWRLSRIRKMEPGFFAKKLQNLKAIREEHYSHLSGYAHLTHVLADDALYQDVYGKMSRYEGRFQRTFFKALKELERLQALRAELSDSGNGTVSQNLISPDPEPQIAPPTAPPSPPIAPSSSSPTPTSQPQVSARGLHVVTPVPTQPPEPANPAQQSKLKKSR
jgi:hypothetical protein